MEQNYKLFMDKQHPSDALMEDTIRKAKTLSEQGEIKRKGTQTWSILAVSVAVLCIVASGIWRWNTKIVYTDLADGISMEKPEVSQGDKNVEDIKNSYLGNEEVSYYIFDKNAEISELEVGQGKISIQIGDVSNAGLQLLYQTKPEQIMNCMVYLGKYKVDNKELLLAAFEKEDKYYYLEGENVTEKEMTACVKDLLK